MEKKNLKTTKNRIRLKNQKLNLPNKSIDLQDRHYFTLMLLYKEKTMKISEMKERSLIFVSQFGISKKFLSMDDPGKKPGKASANKFNLELGCEELIQSGHIQLNQKGQFVLTGEGKKMAEQAVQYMERGAFYVKKIFNKILIPPTAAKLTIILDFFLAAIKMISGFISGSVALLADGADATVDTFSAFMVWLGIKLKKEWLGTTLILMLMFITAGSIGYESVSKIIEAVQGISVPIFKPGLVIIVEVIALLAAILLYFYQHFVGKKHGSLSLVSQSIDSKNHIYVAGAVIIGAVFSMFGIHFVDALIGIFISLRITLDAIVLTREAILRFKGEEIDFSKYQTLIEKKWDTYKLKSFQNWILYTLKENSPLSKKQLLQNLHNTYKPPYIPIVSEFNIGIGRNFDFEAAFETLIRPLIERDWIIQKKDSFAITALGRERIDVTARTLRYLQK